MHVKWLYKWKVTVTLYVYKPNMIKEYFKTQTFPKTSCFLFKTIVVRQGLYSHIKEMINTKMSFPHQQKQTSCAFVPLSKDNENTSFPKV